MDYPDTGLSQEKKNMPQRLGKALSLIEDIRTSGLRGQKRLGVGKELCKFTSLALELGGCEKKFND